MKKLYFLAALIIMLISACDSSNGSTPPSVVDNPDSQTDKYDFSTIDEQLTASLPIYKDTVYVAFKRGDEFIYEYATDGIDINTVFDMASATKWISGAVILSLAEQGYFSLDDEVGDYLQIFVDYGKGNFTIRNAFSMSSGLFDATRPHTNSALTLEQSVNLIAVNTPFVFTPPGSSIAYDGKQMQVIGRIAEVVTGKDWRTIAREQLFDKCGMNNSNYNVFGDINPAVAGGLSTTAADYLTFLNMVMNDGMCGATRILTAASIQEMFTNQTNNAPVLETPWPSNHPDFPYGNDDLRYSFGSWILAQNPDSGVIEELSSPGAWGAFPWADKKRDLYGVIFTYVPLPDGGFQATVDPELATLKLLREIIDNDIHVQ